MNDEQLGEYPRHQFNAQLSFYPTFWAYLRSYKMAFQVLMDNVRKTGLHIDSFAYPILFIARHCLELGFKANIRYFIEYSERDDYKKASTHDLEKLFSAFKLHINSTIKNLKDKHGIIVSEEDVNEFKAYCNEVDKLTNILHLLDKQSDSFRYPIKKDGENSFPGHTTINLVDVKNLFDKSMLLLTHTSDVFGKYTNYAKEIEALYEDEMKSLYGEH